MTSHQISISDVVGVDRSPLYIHKIDRPSYWKFSDDFERRVDDAVSHIFKDSEHLYSFWRIASSMDLYCVAASLNAKRDSPEEDIPFIWLTDLEMGEFGLEPAPSEEGVCLHATSLHVDILIPPEQARALCHGLMLKELKFSEERSRKYREKKHMKEIVALLKAEGCKAYQTNLEFCSCQSIDLK